MVLIFWTFCLLSLHMYIWPLLRSIFCSHLFIVCLLVFYIYHLWLFYWFLIVWDMFLMDIDSSLAINMHYWWFCDDLTNAWYPFSLFCIVKSKFLTTDVSIVDMRSLSYQLIILVVCNALAITVFCCYWFIHYSWCLTWRGVCDA